MSTSPPPLSAAYQTCLNEAFTQCPLIIKRWCSALTEILHERSTGAVAGYEKRILQDSAAALKANQVVIEQGFALELTKAIALDTKAGSTNKVDSASRSFSSLRFDQLELMGDDQVQETLDGARLQQFLLLASDSGLADFSARLSTAQGFKMVQPDKNPLRPEVFSQALLKLLRRLQVDNDLRSRWLTHGAQLLGKELQALYVLLDTLLEKQSIVPAPYGVVGAPEDQNQRPASAGAEGEQGGYAGQQAYPGQAGYSGQQAYPEQGYAAQGGYPAQGGFAAQGGYPVQGGYAGQGGYTAQGGYSSDGPSDLGDYPAQGGYPPQPGQYLGSGYAGQPVYQEPGGHSGQAGGAGRLRHPLPPGYPAQGGQPGVAFDGRMPPRAEATVRVSPEQLLTLDHLHRLMVGDYDESFEGAQLAAEPHGAGAVQQDFSHTLPAAMDALAELEEHGLAKMTGQQARPMPPLPIALLREQLKAEAKSLGQALGIEVVGLMIEKLASDERLLPPVRKLIADAEPAFLRLGMTDPRFFSDKKHPARLLLEAITANSLAYPSEDAPGFAGFMRDLQEVTAVLTEGYLSDAHDFAALLADFEDKQARQNGDTSDAQNLAVQALLRAEQRNLLAEKIALEIRARPDFISGNRVIASFLTGPWAHVMANERLLGEHGGLGSAKAVYSLTLGDLLWSLNVLQASRHRKRLVKIIPGMLNSVREGLLSIDYPLDQSKAFYDELMASHQAAIKPAPDQLEGQTPASSVLDKAFEAGDEGGNEPWLAPSEAQQSGFMEDWEAHSPKADSTLPGQLDTAPDGAFQQGDVPPDEFVETPSEGGVGLLLGAWVELLSDKRWLRAQLTWISPHNTLFMFTSDGGRSHSMTARMLQQLLSVGRVKVVSDKGLLDGALDGVARTAMRNSVDISKGA